MTEAALRGLFDHAGMFPPAAKGSGAAASTTAATALAPASAKAGSNPKP